LIARNIADLNGDTLDQARIGNGLGKQTALTEKKETVKGLGDTPNTHDILTGSTPDGRAYTGGMDHTCYNWTRSSMGSAQVGHSIGNGGGNSSWNSSHATSGCSQAALRQHRRCGIVVLFRD